MIATAGPTQNTQLTASSPSDAEPFSLTPRSLAEAKELATLIAGSSLIPNDYRNQPANVLVAVQMGAELGLPPLQALQAIAVINGRPCIYGDGLMALVRASHQCEQIHETFDDETWTATCTAKRRGQSEQSRSFSQVDAQIAGLWGKPGPWRQYPKRMLQMRARSWCLRDVFADVLKGLTVAEEVLDIEPIPVAQSAPSKEVTDSGQGVRERLHKRAEAVRGSEATLASAASADAPGAPSECSKQQQALRTGTPT